MADELIDPNVQDDQQDDAPVGPNAVVPLTGSFVNTATPIENPQFTEAAAKSAASGEAATRSADAVGPLEAEVTRAKGEGAGKLSDLEKMQVEQQRNLQDIWDQRHAATMAEHNRRVAEDASHVRMLDEAAANARPHEFWEDKSQWDKVRSHIALGLGAFGAALAGTPNFYQDRLKGEMDHYAAAQKEAIDRKFTIAERAAERLKGTKEERDKAVANVDEQRRLAEATLLHTQQMQGKAIADESLKQQLAAGVPLAVAKQNSVVRAAEATRDEKRAAMLQHLDATRTVQTAMHEAQARTGASPQERQEARTLRDPETGAPIGLAPTPRVVEKMAGDIANSRSYVAKVDELAHHIEQFGHLLNPLSDEYKRRQSMIADVQSAGRQVSGIQASDAGQKLEHMMIGGSGTGLERSADPGVLRDLARKAATKSEERLRSALTPVAGARPNLAHVTGAEAPKAAPAKPRKLSPAELAGGKFVP